MSDKIDWHSVAEAAQESTRNAEAKSRLWMEAATKALVERDAAVEKAENYRRDLEDQCTYSAHLLTIVDAIRLADAAKGEK